MTGAPGTAVEQVQLRIDRIKCDGYGMCAELLPELLELDDWGYPIVRRADVPLALTELAERAVGVCPVLALSLASVKPPRPGG